MTTKQASNNQVTFVTQKRFAVLFFPPPCCANSLFLLLFVENRSKNLSAELLRED